MCWREVSALLDRLGSRVLVLAYRPELTSFLLEVCGVAMISLALFCSCCGALLLAICCRLLLGVWVWAPWPWSGLGYGLCMDFVLHHWGGGGGGRQNSPFDTNTVVMLRIITRPVRYCCDLVYSELIMLCIFL